MKGWLATLRRMIATLARTSIRPALWSAAALLLSAPLAWSQSAAQPSVFETREADWRNGAIVYQVMVDRFAPSANLEAKRALYPAPKVLHPWSEPAKRGTYVESAHVWSHEIDFWGGDLASTTAKLGYVQDQGADVLNLNPNHLA